MDWKNKEDIKTYQKAYRLAHRDEWKAYQQAYHKIYGKIYRLAHKDERTAYRLAHKDKFNTPQRVYSKKFYEANKEKIKLKVKIYQLANPDKMRMHERKRKALKLGTGHEPYMETSIFERDGWICQICGRKINKRLKWPNPLSKSIDHIIPLIKGGNDAPINVQATHLRCNLSKNANNGGQLRLIG